DAADEVLGVHAAEADVGLQREHGAGEERSEDDDGDGVDAEAHHLPQPLHAFERTAERPDDGLPEHREPEPRLLEHLEEDEPDALENGGHDLYTLGTRALMRQKTS